MSVFCCVKPMWYHQGRWLKKKQSSTQVCHLGQYFYRSCHCSQHIYLSRRDVETHLHPKMSSLLCWLLWLNLMLEDLGYRFNLSKGSISRMFHTWIDVTYARLKFLIVWPTRDVVRHNMPQVFKGLYPTCRCIIDCSIFIERSFSLKARAQTYSNYKHHNTVKILIAISPHVKLYRISCLVGADKSLINI